MTLAVDAGTASIVAAVIVAAAGVAVAIVQHRSSSSAKATPSVPEAVRDFTAKLSGAMNAVDEAVSFADEEVDIDELSKRVANARHYVNEAAGMIGGVRPLVTQEAASHADKAIADLREAADLLDQGMRSEHLGFFWQAGKALSEAQPAGRDFEDAIRV